MFLIFSLVEHRQIKVIEVSHEVEGVVLILLKLVVNLQSIGRWLELLVISLNAHGQGLTLIDGKFIEGFVINHGLLPDYCLPPEAPLASVVLLHINWSHIIPAATLHIIRVSQSAHARSWDR